MTEADFPTFARLLDAVYALHGKALAAEPKALFFRAMSGYSLAVVRGALDAHVRDPQRGQFPPKPADLMAQIEGNAEADGRPGPDEAWAIALTSRDEAETVVWTPEIAQAFAVCSPVLDTGDKVGARVAFKDAYARLVTAARREGKPCTWDVSLGWDQNKRKESLEAAVRLNLLPAPTAAALLPAPTEADGYNPDKARANLAKLRKMLAGLTSPAERAQRQREAENRVRREVTQAQKAVIDRRVREYRGAQA